LELGEVFLLAWDAGSDPILDMFIFETLQLADQLEKVVLTNEKYSSFKMEKINEVFRIMHTIKGSAAMMFFNNISAVAHSMEDLFFYIRENELLELDYSELCDLILAGIDFIKMETVKIQEGGEADSVPDKLLQQIQGFLDSIKPNDSKNLSTAETSPGISLPDADIDLEGSHYRAAIFFEDGCEMENIRAFNVISKMEDTFQLLRYFPPDIIENADTSLAIRENGFIVEFAGDGTLEELEKFFLSLPFVESIEIRELTGETEQVEAAVSEDACPDEEQAEDDQNKNTRVSLKKQSIISVQLTKLDKLLDLVGELVISEAMVTNNPDLAQIRDLENFKKAARQHRKIINELQDVVMSIRMVPLNGIFQRMHRIVWDMSKKLDKQVELITLGEETEVDKNIIEHLSDPIMHLIRNAVDHGIEPLEERMAKGKPAAGRIQLEAKSEGGDVLITVRDDGGGLDKEKILRKAIEQGLVSETETGLSDHEVYNFIILPGFSTNQEVTEYSGRGVGMDVVAENIEEIGGSVQVDSRPGIGTAITMRIPLTLAIMDGMGIRVGRSIYTIPITAIRESFKAGEGEVFTDPDGLEMIMVRGECLTILRLHKLFGIETPVTEIHEGIVIIVENAKRTLCLFADELIGEQQVVVKALPRYLKKIRGISGCTLLGDGRSSLILDIAGLINCQLN